jgi:hypothetical protein
VLPFQDRYPLFQYHFPNIKDTKPATPAAVDDIVRFWKATYGFEKVITTQEK